MPKNPPTLPALKCRAAPGAEWPRVYKSNRG
uniref:Uncharacterized protein n=1 Tax=Phage sp. ctR9T2 TaxID=2825795 RepID=A0A8S5UFS7_9VIRU|nr:MAG TPA: hypothetical protein [Phage sp. ctR9T2]